jgi:hypothetical protein
MTAVDCTHPRSSAKEGKRITTTLLHGGVNNTPKLSALPLFISSTGILQWFSWRILCNTPNKQTPIHNTDTICYTGTSAHLDLLQVPTSGCQILLP